MDAAYDYTCPNCSKHCSVLESLAGQNVTCPNCGEQFFATPPESQADSAPEASQACTIPDKLPFFKSGRRKLLEHRYDQIISSGGIDAAAEAELDSLTAQLGLKPEDLSDINQAHFRDAMNPIQKRMEATFLMTDEDLSEISGLEKKYRLKARLEGYANLFRLIYLVESTGKLPPPVDTGLMLDEGEIAYFSIPSTWLQSRVHSHGYSGTSISLPTGISGVRFRFGGYTPIKTDDMTPLSTGTLYVTSQRLLFNGDSRNTAIAIKKIIDGHVFSDSLRIDKTTGKPDLFAMDAANARYILSLIGAIK